jgi:Mg-chelatase subunit ChlI
MQAFCGLAPRGRYCIHRLRDAISGDVSVPDEGDLRPQLSDRFAHGILIQDDFSDQQRIEIVKRRIAFDDDPENFVARFSPSMRELGDRIARARQRITEVIVSDEHRMICPRQRRQAS